MRLRLPSAVTIQSLSRQQVQYYVDQAGTSVRRADGKTVFVPGVCASTVRPVRTSGYDECAMGPPAGWGPWGGPLGPGGVRRRGRPPRPRADTASAWRPHGWAGQQSARGNERGAPLAGPGATGGQGPAGPFGKHGPSPSPFPLTRPFTPSLFPFPPATGTPRWCIKKGPGGLLPPGRGGWAPPRPMAAS